MAVLSLYDYTGEALRPWALAGHTCYAIDIQHTGDEVERFDGGGSINYVRVDLYDSEAFATLAKLVGDSCTFGMAFPVCTDLAVSGAAHFASKEAARPGFQRQAADHAIRCGLFFEELGVPYFIENPVSRLATLWRKPDYRFHPYEYGGYLNDDEATHPKWPDYIAPRDAYSKKTCLWAGQGFIMPEPKPVACESFGASAQYQLLGGKSMKTKNIRSATPRGFAKAVFEVNNRSNNHDRSI